MCMEQEFIFLTILIRGPKHPKWSLDDFLQPLIQELKVLWSDEVRTYDCSMKNNFTMRAVLLWTISDFPSMGCCLAGQHMEGYLVHIVLDRQMLFNWKMVGRVVGLIVIVKFPPFPSVHKKKHYLCTKELSETVLLHISLSNRSK